MSTETDEAIAAYRQQLAAEAELAASDLDEIEDHLRTLADDLRARGLPATDAIAEAARRLGNPRTLAREHVRVRTAFGSQLSRARRFSAALIMVPFLVLYAFVIIPQTGIYSRHFAEFILSILLVTALASGVTWARAIVLGGMGFWFIPTLAFAFYGHPVNLVSVGAQLAVIAFVAPWRRGELSPAGAALSLQVWAYCAAMYASGYRYTSTGDTLPWIDPLTTIALVSSMLALLGGILRARWSGIFSAITAVSLGIALVEIWSLTWPGYELLFYTLRGCVMAAVAAALAGSVLAWRNAHSRYGSLAHVLR